MLAMLALWIGGSTLVQWWQIHQDDVRYGRPRTSQVDAVVGHGDSPAHPTHFIAVNLHGHIQIIEEPGGDPTRARVYLGSTLLGDGAELTPVTLAFQDVNGDGQLDMVIRAGNSVQVYINDKGTFRPTQSTDKISL
jgi:hypothetical protein